VSGGRIASVARLIIGVVPIAIEPEELHRLSLDEYHRLIEAGGFDEDARIELIDGLLVRMSPKTREHENAIAWLARWLMLTIDQDRYEVRIASALTLETSEPEPDLIVFPRDAPRAYHPSTAALVIEVSVSSLHRDLRQKPTLYSRAGVAEYWVVDLDGGRIVVHRGPTDGGYDDVTVVHGGERLAVTAVELPVLEVDELLRAANT
jgi:Uma2 family endonuclease